jgi:pimeloyl-ACP methyl ester carboxylesterase
LDGTRAGWDTVGASLGRAIDDVLSRDPLRPAILAAYSFGARLALAVPGLDAGEGALAAACLVSAHPGLSDERSRLARRAADREWARRLLEDPEEDVLRDWDAQPVLARSGARGAGRGFPASRETLAAAMTGLSLAEQPDFRPRLAAWRAPLLWIAGGDDAKFAGLAGEIAAIGLAADVEIVEGAGHRVPFDAPAAFARALTSWVDKRVPRRDDADGTRRT